ncbi:MAG: ABC transporter permease [Bryobacterales bacterium]
MGTWKRFQHWITGRADSELDCEIRAHLELEAEDQHGSGTPSGQAGYAAHRNFGNRLSIKEDVRAAWGWGLYESLAQDFRYALRAIRKSPGFSTVATVSLALGIGANTAIFTFVNAALLKPLPYPNADRIVALAERSPQGGNTSLVHPQSFVEWLKRARSFEALAIAQAVPINTQGGEGAEEVRGLWSTASLFRVLGVEPMLGRVFTDEEGFDRAAIRGQGPASSVAILSQGYWERRFGSDPAIVGKSISLSHGSATVIGVMPPGFRVATANVDIYISLPLDPSKPEAAGSRSFQCYGLLRPGVSIDEARAEMDIVATQAGRDVPFLEGWGVSVASLRDHLVKDSFPVLMMLAGVVALVLLIACANLAALLLTRGVGRQSELALRASLGAGRARLVQQLLIESVTIAVMGGLLGLLFGSWASRALVLLATDAVAFGQMEDVQLDGRVLAFTLLRALLTAIVFGLAPAWQASRFNLQNALKQHGRGGGEHRGQQRFRNALVIGEVALAAVLLVGAGLLLRTLSHLLDVRLGFDPAQVLALRTFVNGDPARRSSLVESILERVEALPEVRAAGTIQFLPLGGWTNNGPFEFVGKPSPADPQSMETDVSTVSRGYFSALGIPVLRGRPFERRDSFDGARVALVNQSFADKYCPQYCPDGDPIGQLIFGDWADPKPTEIVGMVGDIRHNGLTAEPRPTVFLAQAQVPGYITSLVVRTAAEPEQMAAAIRREVQQVDPNQPLTAIQPMEQYISRALARPRLYSALLGAFASLALVLAAIGLYGLLAYAVRRRTHEIGIRLALGAQPGAVLRSTMAVGIRLAAVGLALGVLCAIALSRFVASLLYGVGTDDLLTFGIVTALLAAVALLAAYVPARRAARVDPMVALRYE